jgi:hypothetical protein
MKPARDQASHMISVRGYRVSPAYVIGVAAILLQLCYVALLKPLLLGDGPYYLIMQQAWISTGTPVISQSIVDRVAAVYKLYQEIPLPPGGLFYTLSPGRWIGFHHPFYSLFTVPFAWLFGGTPNGTLHSFSAFNLLCSMLAIIVLLRSRLTEVQKIFIGICFVTSTTFYIRWPHPEVYTAALLLIGIVFWLEGRIAPALACLALSSWQNPSAIFASVILLHSVSPIEALRKHVPALSLFIALSLVPYFYTYALTAKWSLIGSSGFIDYQQISINKWISLVFDLNQGMIILLVPVLVAAIISLLSGGRREDGALKKSGWLLAAFVAISIPVLAQINWNSGQYLVLRYVVWLIVPVYMAVAVILSERSVASCAAVAALYLALLSWVGYELGINRGSLNELQNRPWVRISTVLKYYDPLPEIFVPRAVGHQVSDHELQTLLPVMVRPDDRTFSKILGREEGLSKYLLDLCSLPQTPMVLRQSPAPSASGGSSDLQYFVVSGC